MPKKAKSACAGTPLVRAVLAWIKITGNYQNVYFYCWRHTISSLDVGAGVIQADIYPEELIFEAVCIEF